MFKIVIASFKILNKLKKSQFFQKTFLFFNINIEVILRILFLSLNIINIAIVDYKLI